MKIESQMNDLRLPGMMRRWESLKETKQVHGLSLLEGLELLLQAEAEHRDNRKRDRLTQQANFRYQAIISEISYLPGRNLDKTTIALLSDSGYIAKGEFILINGHWVREKFYRFGFRTTSLRHGVQDLVCFHEKTDDEINTRKG